MGTWRHNRIAPVAERVAVHPQSSTALGISVVVATYGRPDKLMECIAGLQAQALQPAEVLIVVSPDDHQTKDALASQESGSVKVIECEGGFVPQLNAGLASAQGAIVAFIDDDAVPRPDWLARIHEHFVRDPELGGVGGRDLQPGDPGPPAAVVGRVAWYGRLVGNHHRGFGTPRRVDLLKGVNMAFRAAAVRDLEFEKRLLGEGLQTHSEIGFCLALQTGGWKLIYDPALLVDHDWGVRPDHVRRGSKSLSNVFIEAHNQLLGLAVGLTSVRRATAIAYALLFGDRGHPGPLLALERLLVGREGWEAVRRMRASTRGRLRALSTLRVHRERK
jgi:GT2 family glycosyltransferase